jgi:hypothetical protein
MDLDVYRILLGLELEIDEKIDPKNTSDITVCAA